jgi:glycyl-tRNA synthetase
LKLHPKIAPIKIAILPLVNKLEKPSKLLFDQLKSFYPSIYDKSGSVGKRYARADEIGIPYCITVDFDTEKTKSVTIRDRNTTKQIRVKIADLEDTLFALLYQDLNNLYLPYSR